MEEREEGKKKPFHNALDKSDRKKKSLIGKRLTFQDFTSPRDGVKALLFLEFFSP
jgi:hypothetical protein